MFDSSVFVGEDVRFKSSMCRKGASHSLHTIFSYLAQGYTPKQIRNVEPDILPETIVEARLILAGRSAKFLPEAVCDVQPQNLKVLIDENISPAVAGFLRTHFKKVAHVNDVGLTGKKDDKLWEWAIENGYHIIFTHDKAKNSDKDLTFIATEEARKILRARDNNILSNLTLSDLPLIVHLPGGGDPEAELKKLLRKNKEKFLNFLSERATPYMDVKNGKITPGPIYCELQGSNYMQSHNMTRAMFARKRESREFFKALWLGHLSANEIRYMQPEREAAVDLKIENYFAKQESRPSVFN